MVEAAVWPLRSPLRCSWGCCPSRRLLRSSRSSRRVAMRWTRHAPCEASAAASLLRSHWSTASSRRFRPTASPGSAGSCRCPPTVRSTFAARRSPPRRTARSRTRSARSTRGPQTAGQGVGVALVDTGVAPVADLLERVVAVADLTPERTLMDGFGHGTFMAGLIAGDGTSSEGRYTGVAPAADLISIKVALADGSTTLGTVLSGLQLVRNARDIFNIRVALLALSSPSTQSPEKDPLSKALRRLWNAGIFVVVPAGNDGPESGTIDSPGFDPVLMTAGAVDDRGTMAVSDDDAVEWTSRGPTPWGAAKPEVAAPGAHIVSLRVPGSTIDDENPSARVEGGYFRGSGTSMSAAITAGVAALVLSSDPSLGPNELKQRLIEDATPLDGADPDAVGAGVVRANVDGSGSSAVPAGKGKGGSRRGGGHRNGKRWTGRIWDGRIWDGRIWDGRVWDGRVWDGRVWDGRVWDGRVWEAVLGLFSGRAGSGPAGSGVDVRPENAKRLVIRVVVLGGATALAAAWAAAPPVLDTPTIRRALILMAIGIGAELVSIRIPRGATSEQITLGEVAIAAQVALLPLALAPVVAVAGLTVSLIVRRRPLVKTAYNAGQYAIATFAAVTCFHGLGGGDLSSTAGLVGLFCRDGGVRRLEPPHDLDDHLHDLGRTPRRCAPQRGPAVAGDHARQLVDRGRRGRAVVRASGARGRDPRARADPAPRVPRLDPPARVRHRDRGREGEARAHRRALERGHRARRRRRHGRAVEPVDDEAHRGPGRRGRRQVDRVPSPRPRARRLERAGRGRRRGLAHGGHARRRLDAVAAGPSRRGARPVRNDPMGRRARPRRDRRARDGEDEEALPRDRLARAPHAAHADHRLRQVPASPRRHAREHAARGAHVRRGPRRAHAAARRGSAARLEHGRGRRAARSTPGASRSTLADVVEPVRSLREDVPPRAGDRRRGARARPRRRRQAPARARWRRTCSTTR